MKKILLVKRSCTWIQGYRTIFFYNLKDIELGSLNNYLYNLFDINFNKMRWI